MTATAFTTVAGLAIAAGLVAVSAASDDRPKPAAVEFTVHSGYFEKNNSGLKGESSYLLFTDAKLFDNVFGVAFTQGKKPNVLPADAFDSKLVVAAIKRGGDLWEYRVEGVTLVGTTLNVRYAATARDGGGARYASPLIISVPKGSIQSVIFNENGKEAGKATVRSTTD